MRPAWVSKATDLLDYSHGRVRAPSRDFCMAIMKVGLMISVMLRERKSHSLRNKFLITCVCIFLYNITYAKTIVVSNAFEANGQFVYTNCLYKINCSINLQGGDLNIPAHSTLLFGGNGEIINGTVVCNNTQLKGSIKVSRIRGTLKNKSFRSSYSSLKCNRDKLEMLLRLDIDTIVLDENYVVSETGHRIYTKVPAIIGKDIRIDVCADVLAKDSILQPDFFIVHSASIKEFSGVQFDFHNHICKGVLLATAYDRATISNIVIDNIDIRLASVSNQSFINGINLNACEGSQIVVKCMKVHNLLSRADGIIDNSGGNVSAIYVSAAAKVQTSVSVINCTFNEIHNYSASDDYLVEDANGIYIHFTPPCSAKCKVKISNITGANFGKRLIKTDCSNVIIERINGRSWRGDSMSLISVNNGKGCNYSNAIIKDIRFEGVVNYVVGSGIPETIIDHLTSIITRQSSTYSSALYAMSSCCVSNLELYGAQQIAFVTEAQGMVKIRNVKYDDTGYDHMPYQLSAFITANAHICLDNLELTTNKIQSLFIDNYPNRRDYNSNVEVSINNISIDVKGNVLPYFINIPGVYHSWDIKVKRAFIDIEGSADGVLAIISSKESKLPVSVSLETVRLRCDSMGEGGLTLGTIMANEYSIAKLRDVVVDCHNSAEIKGTTSHKLYAASKLISQYANISIIGCAVKSQSGAWRIKKSTTADCAEWIRISK